MSKFSVVGYLFGKDRSIFEGGASGRRALELIKFYNDIPSLINYIKSLDGCLVIASVKDRGDAELLETLLKNVKIHAPDLYIEIMSVSSETDSRVNRILERLNISDRANRDISNKTLNHKLVNMVKKMGNEMKTRAEKRNSGLMKGALIKNFFWSPAIPSEHDIWIAKEQSIKRVGNVWVLKLNGPYPDTGKWILSQDKKIWRFTVKEEFRISISAGKGEWKFKGQSKPEYLKKENLWVFTGEDMELFYLDDAQKYHRFYTKGRNMVVSQNSQEALTKRQASPDGPVSKFLNEKIQNPDDAKQFIKNVSGNETISLEDEFEIILKEGILNQLENSSIIVSKEEWEPTPVLITEETATLQAEIEKLTKNTIESGYIAQKGVHSKCSFSDLYEDILIVVTDTEKLGPNKSTVIELGIVYMDNESNITLRGETTDIIGESGEFYVTMKINSEDVAKAQEYLKVRSMRETNAGLFISRAQGR